MFLPPAMPSKIPSVKMTRLETLFTQLGERNQAAFIPFVTAGDPNFATSLQLLHCLAEHGADIIELGMPFTDPAADGPTIQKANERALQHDISLPKILELVTQFRTKNNTTPLILMGYANPLYHYGMRQFGMDAQKAGADGIITVDIPMEEDEDSDPLREFLAVIRLIAPTSGEGRIKQLCQKAQGFIYYITIAGITGTKEAAMQNLKHSIARIKKYSSLPVAVGFGIRDEESARQAAQIADGVVIGSALIDEITKSHEQQQGQQKDILAAITHKTQKMADAIHGART